MPSNAAFHRSGIKLIECIVVLIILLMILAVAAPYLLQNRELARKNQCQQKMIELNRGLQEYANSTGLFPPGRAEPQPYSALAGIIPLTSAADKLSQVDFQQQPEQSDLSQKLIPLLLCPSDPSALSVQSSNTPAGLCSFAMSTGSGSVNNGSLNQADGIFGLGSGLSIHEVMEGSSNTVAFSERILGTGEAPPTSRSLSNPNQQRWFIWELPIEMVANQQNCQGDVGVWNAGRGRSWLVGDYRNTLYNHALPPNSAESDCSNTEFNSGRFSASSFHWQGVNVSLCDGSVQFIGNSIDQQIWQGISIRGSVRNQQPAE